MKTNKKLSLVLLILYSYSFPIIAQIPKEYRITGIWGNVKKEIKIGSVKKTERQTFKDNELIYFTKGEGLYYEDLNSNYDGEDEISYELFNSINKQDPPTIKMTISQYYKERRKKLTSERVAKVTQGTLIPNKYVFSFVGNDIPLNNDNIEYNKIALIVGNVNYNNWGRLHTSENSAYAVAEKLREMGFRTLVVIDADYDYLISALNFFYEVSEKYETKIFYYVGHGKSDKLNDYIVPTNISENNLDSCVSITKVANNLNRGNLKQTRLVFFDACRTWDLSHEGDEYKPEDGTVIMYSTDEGCDSHPFTYPRDKYTIFSQAFLDNIDSPDNIKAVLERIKVKTVEISRKANKSQIPRIKEYGTDWDNIYLVPKNDTLKEINHYAYWGLAGGYPYCSAYIGGQFDLSKGWFGLVELGWSVHFGGKSDEVYLYNSSNIAEHGYTYCPDRFLCPNLHVGVGYNITENFSLSLLGGVSYLRIKGSPIASYASSKGEKAAAICYSPNLRAVWTPRKSKPWKLQLTIGYDFAKGDDNYGVLKDIDQIKGMVEGFRCQIGFICKF